VSASAACGSSAGGACAYAPGTVQHPARALAGAQLEGSAGAPAVGGQRPIAAQEDALRPPDARDAARLFDHPRDREPVLQPRRALEHDGDRALQRLGDAQQRVRRLAPDRVPARAGRERERVGHQQRAGRRAHRRLQHERAGPVARAAVRQSDRNAWSRIAAGI